jgi:hypothetical protein
MTRLVALITSTGRDPENQGISRDTKGYQGIPRDTKGYQGFKYFRVPGLKKT